MSPAFERIDLTFADWDKIVSTFEDRTLFQTSEWLTFIKRTQNAEPVFAALRKGTRTLGYFSGLVVRRFGLKILGSPLPGWTTSYMGMNLLEGVSRRVGLRALLSLALDELKCAHIEIMDRNVSVEDARALGVHVRTFEGFEIDLNQSEGQLFANMSSACRRCIRQAEKYRVIVEEGHDQNFAHDYYMQLQEVFRRQALVPTYGIDRVRALIDHLSGSGRLLLLRARDQDGRCIATGIFPALNDTMYFWGGASRTASLGYRPNEVLHWHAMKYWKARGMRRYDMGGGGEYKRKFGGCRIVVPWIRMSRYPGLSALREVARCATGWRQWVLGKTAFCGDV
jgi:Acetyltransferase (GNAT) domain